MTKWILSIVFLITGYCALAQSFYSTDTSKAVEEDKVRQAELGVGILVSAKGAWAVPFGMFGNKNLLDFNQSYSAGFADPAMGLGLEIEAHGKNIWLAGLHMNYAVHNFDQEPVVDVIATDTTINGFQAGEWRIMQPLIALGLQHMQGNIAVELKGLVGVTWTRTPQFSFDGTYLGFAYSEIHNEISSFSPTFGGGFAARYHFDKFFLKFFSEITFSSTSIQEEIDLNLGGVRWSTSQAVTYDLNTFRTGLSVGVRF